ncbi:MAG: SPOR domain-containing protein [Bacteriovoracaceae bacterium]|nr:SPOR domain-containing protein [Bacteriovoracaceae bacterium]
MDSKTKLYVFAKKEVALIFIFMILIAVTSFVLGVKIGKNYSMEMAGITKEDEKKVVELLSTKEESLEAIKANPEASTIESSEIENKLQEKISEEFGTGAATNTNHSVPNMSVKAPDQTPLANDELSGKYTIQLGSHRTLKEAESFAEAFRARGYNPIINQIEIKGKGTWYRVSLEAFNSQEEARAYVTKEKSLFTGQDYNIIKMP